MKFARWFFEKHMHWGFARWRLEKTWWGSPAGNERNKTQWGSPAGNVPKKWFGMGFQNYTTSHFMFKCSNWFCKRRARVFSFWKSSANAAATPPSSPTFFHTDLSWLSPIERSSWSVPGKENMPFCPFRTWQDLWRGKPSPFFSKFSLFTWLL